MLHGGKFKDVCEVVSKAYREEKPLWEDKLYPLRIKIKRIFKGEVDIRTVFDQLLFMTNKKSGKGG
ncbi:MAG: hypothetical protein J7K21_07760 [Desulfurococcales archaeon]|nr:hypothetical protein [Desulfurococcales archaeon]